MTMFDKLGSVAARVDKDKGLYFFAVVHPTDGLHDRWDLLVSSPNLEPWSMDALRYVSSLLQKALTVGEIVRISRIVVLPRDNQVIASIMANDQVQARRLTSLHDEQFDRVFLVHPVVQEHQTALST